MRVPKDFQTIFLKKEQVGGDVWTFYFDRTGVDVPFLPGQHLSVILPFVENSAENNRLFTISSSPLEKNLIAITVKEGISIFKKALFAMSKQTIVKLKLPLGSFTLDLTKSTTSVLLSGGVGITPFYSMLRTLQDEKLDQDILLFASFSTPENIVFYTEMKEIEKKNKKIKIIYSLTQKVAKTWKGEKGRVTGDMILKYVPDLKSNTYYISGGIEFISGIADMLLSRGVTKDQGKIEQFIGL